MTLQARLIAVDHVHIEAPPRVRVALTHFYADLIGLRPIAPTPQVGREAADETGNSAAHDAPARQDVLRYIGERHELRIALLEQPAVESVDARVQIEVRSLEDTAALLDEQRIEYTWLHGVQFTNRSLSVLDPAGNRVLLRKLWPFQMV